MHTAYSAFACTRRSWRPRWPGAGVFLVCALVAVACGHAVAAQTYKGKKTVWVISGQSNACGRGKLPGLDRSPLVEMFNGKTRQWEAAQDPLPGMNTEGVGPWQAAGVEVATACGAEVRLTGFATSGQPIANWAPGANGYQALLPIIQRNGVGADVFLWYQGESDGMKKMPADEYSGKLKDLVAAVRKTAANPKMTVVVVQLAHLADKSPGEFMAIREGERQFVLQDPHAVLVPALGCAAGDYVHLAREGYLQLGKRIGRALLRTQYGDKHVDWPGPVMDQAVLQADGKTVVAHFAEAAALTNGLAADFAALAPGGAPGALLSPTSIEMGRTLVTLRFANEIPFPSRLVYGAGNNPRATLSDEAGNPAPAVQLELTKGAPPADVPTVAPNGAGPAAAGK